MEKKNQKIVAIIQAHMSSTRLPGKVLKDLCGAPALYRMIERVRHAELLDDIVIATSTLPCDDIIIECCESWGVNTFRGSDSDVLSRYWGAAQAYPADIYVRLTSDCPLIDPGQLDESIQYFLDHGYRYVHGDGKLPGGIGGEVFTAELLKEAFENSTEGYEHEHVTPYMYWKQDSIGECPSKEDGSMYRITLDTPEDYEVIRLVYEALYEEGNHFTLDDILTYLKAHPEVVAINAMIVQKKVK